MSGDDSSSDGDNSKSSEDSDLLRRNQLLVKQELNEQREQLLNDLPKEYKQKFGAIGFGKWSKRWLPVLIRGPYDVGPGETRQSWMAMYEKVSRSGMSI